MMLYEKYFNVSLGMEAPGFSYELETEIKRILGEDNFNRAQAKTYGLNAADDYVHCFGKSWILDSNIRY